MDEPNPPSVRRSKEIGVALGLLILPALLYVVLWSLLKNSEAMIPVFFGAPVLCGVGAGAILTRSMTRTPAARVVGFLAFSTGCVIVSFILTLVGCGLVNPIRS